MVTLIEASVLKRTGRASIQKKALSISELLVKLIEPTFSKKKKRSGFHVCTKDKEDEEGQG